MGHVGSYCPVWRLLAGDGTTDVAYWLNLNHLIRLEQRLDSGELTESSDQEWNEVPSSVLEELEGVEEGCGKEENDEDPSSCE